MRGVQQLLEVMKQLRDPRSGCPWDIKQTFDTIAPYTIEEAYEVADVIARKQWDELADELGDLLFQVVFHAQLASEKNLFNFEDVAEAIIDKMIRRHPHVFADDTIKDDTDQSIGWEAHKAAERRAKGEGTSLMDPVTTGLPAMRRAVKLQKCAAKVGLDWSDTADVLSKVHEELGELEQAICNGPDEQSIAEELGDLLFTCVNLARHLKLDPDAELRMANLKFETRFRHMELAARARTQSLEQMSPTELDVLWEYTKSSSAS